MLSGQSLLQIILILTVVGCCLAAAVWWSKRDLFLLVAVVGVFATIGGLFVLMWPASTSMPTPNILPPSAFSQSSSTPMGSLPRESRPPQSTSPSRSFGDESDRQTLLRHDSPAPPRSRDESLLQTLEPYRPAEIPSAGYVGSDACRRCHQQQHATWHASYHRTMTQVAAPEAVIADFNNVSVEVQERQYRLTRTGEVCRVAMNDPDLPVSPATRMTVPIVMTTGSHHMQVYWYPARIPRILGQLPIVFLKETQQWIPRNSALLCPPDSTTSSEMGRWNVGCSNCHTTHPRRRPRYVKQTPGRDPRPDTFDTHVAEFGISCEACHGPGEAHVALRQQSDSANLDIDPIIDPIVDPRKLSHRAAAQVCGQCHSGHTNLEDLVKVKESGHGYRPGDDLHDTHRIWKRDDPYVRKAISEQDYPEGDKLALRRIFWDDGMIRISGREFSGLENSACYQHGEMSCLSCHALHKSKSDPRSLSEWANDQLSLVGTDDRSCTQCHDAKAYGNPHTHHLASSPGARCYNCHMPHTTYGLLKAIRSHTISSPNVKRDLAAHRPNACNLCHLDKTLDWCAKEMNQWYGAEIPELSEEQQTVAASLLWLLKGDAGARALAAWHMGWQDAQTTSGTDWIAPLLAQALKDPYDAVRFIARRSIRTLPGFEGLEFDAMSSQEVRSNVASSILEMWQGAATPERKFGSHILSHELGVQADRIRQLMQRRDDSIVWLLE